VPITDEIRAALEAAVEPSWEQWVADMEARGAPGRKVLDLILQLAEDATAAP
jgi:hypothetical protein